MADGSHRVQVGCTGSSTVASRWVKTPISLPPAIASSMSCTELSRATASGMNECGYSTVSRSGRMGSSSGSVMTLSRAGRVRSHSPLSHLGRRLQPRGTGGDRRYRARGLIWPVGASGRRRAASRRASRGRGRSARHRYRRIASCCSASSSTNRTGTPRHPYAAIRSRSSAVSRASSQSLQRTAKGSARRRASEISSPHSKQSP